jgi:hypothetical protein
MVTTSQYTTDHSYGLEVLYEALYQGHHSCELEAFYPNPLLERFCWSLSERLQDYLLDGWTAYLITFKFKPLPGSKRLLLERMLNEIERVYYTFRTWVVRNPQSPSQRQLCPILLVAPDVPVPKTTKPTSNSMLINDGLHYHGILLIPARSRLKVSVIEHFANKKKLYVKNCLLELDVRPINSNVPRVLNYIFKSVKRGRFTWEDWHLFGPTG